MEDYIFIEELAVDANIGVTEEERRNKQKVFISIKIYKDLKKAGLSDDLADTINYEEIVKIVDEEVKNNQWNLVEKMGYDLAKLVKQKTIKEKIEIVIKKKIIHNTAGTGCRVVL